MSQEAKMKVIVFFSCTVHSTFSLQIRKHSLASFYAFDKIFSVLLQKLLLCNNQPWFKKKVLV